MSDHGNDVPKSLDGKAEDCERLTELLLRDHNLIIVSNRGPVTLHIGQDGKLQIQRGGGGLVTALVGMAQNVEATWIASAVTEADRAWKGGVIPIDDTGYRLRIQFISPEQEAYDGYYNVIANPLLWFLQHSMWDFPRAPTIDKDTWKAWDQGYVAVNRVFANAVIHEIQTRQQPVLVMLQDYHLYLAPLFIRQKAGHEKRYILLHFIHIPWPGPEDWGLLPPRMRRSILEGLCSCDLLGFQTRLDSLNFIRTIESYLPGSHVNYRRGRVWYRNHATYVRDFPISIDVQGLRKMSESPEVARHRSNLEYRFGKRSLIVRVDRMEPSKNILRGFQAFDEMLELHPEHRNKVQFLAVLVPSRMEVSQYQDYLDDMMAAAGRVNARYGDSEWEPVRMLVGEDYSRAVAAMQMYDILLVNSIADGMNLVAKEGPMVNQRDGVVILSERTGALQQLGPGALVIPPLDIYATAEAMHQALVMPLEERQARAARLRSIIEREDIKEWLCKQLEEIARLNL